MDMSGEYRIPAPRQVVWDALNDPEVLKASIAGCEELEPTEDGGFTAKVRAKVGPVSARFSGKVVIVDPDPPNGYRIEGEGTGGAAGFAKGGANVSLAEEGGETVLTYEANASVGGKLAQIGSRLIDGTAKKMADDFFAKFSIIAAERAEGGESPPAAAVEQPPRPMDAETGAVPPPSPAPVAAGAAAEPMQPTVADGDPAPKRAADSAPQPETPYNDGAPTLGGETSEALAEAVSETVNEAAEVADRATKGIPQWFWIAGAALIVVGLLIFLS